MPILARFANFYDFHDFRKAVAAAFSGISEISMVDFEIHSFSFYLLINFCFPVTQLCAREIESRGETEGFFSHALIHFFVKNDNSSKQ